MALLNVQTCRNVAVVGPSAAACSTAEGLRLPVSTSRGDLVVPCPMLRVRMHRSNMGTRRCRDVGTRDRPTADRHCETGRTIVRGDEESVQDFRDAGG